MSDYRERIERDQKVDVRLAQKRRKLIVDNTYGLPERGHRVFAGVRKPADGKRLKRAGGGNISAVAIDVTDPAAIDSAVATLRAALNGDRLDALFKNGSGTRPSRQSSRLTARALSSTV